jgi:hypothetical protein
MAVRLPIELSTASLGHRGTFNSAQTNVRNVVGCCRFGIDAGSAKMHFSLNRRGITLQKNLTILIGIVATATITTTACARDTSESAMRVLERTKTTSATYSMYLWNRVAKPGQPVLEEASVEFHKGDFHRVETPRDRIVANCREQTGFYLSVVSGEIIEGPKVAAVACGINTNFPFISVDLLPDVRTDFGTAQRVRVVDAENIRVYDVLQNGALVQTTYTENRPGGSLLIVTQAIRLDDVVPDEGMFTKASLATRFLPDKLEQ